MEDLIIITINGETYEIAATEEIDESFPIWLKSVITSFFSCPKYFDLVYRCDAGEYLVCGYTDVATLTN